YKGNKYACPNLYADELGTFDPEINDAFRFADCRMFIAYKGRKIVGRIAGIYHKGVNEKFGYKQVRFTRFDVIDDFEVTKALFDKLIEWARELGMEEIIGPMSFDDMNEEGMLIDGFDRDSNYIEIYNHAYYVDHMEKLGAYKIVDWNAYRIKVPEKVDDKLKKLADEVMEKNGFTIIDVAYYLKHDKKKLREYVMQALDVLDEAFEDLYGTSPLSEKQKKRNTETLLQACIPEFACLVAKDDKVIAYAYCIPTLKEVLQKGKGKILPGGLIPYIKTMSHPEVADMLSLGVKKQYNNKGIPAIMIAHILQGLIDKGVKYVEAGPELEENRHVQNLWKNYEADLAKKYRCWGLKVDGDKNQS
ncbi:MAG: hypothetical protein K2N47_01995, partial [Clostridia bacterium]|nr:hypothetical protein [Clostridia bacterium]